MKRRIIAVLMSAIAIGLVACGESNVDLESVETTEVSETTETTDSEGEEKKTDEIEQEEPENEVEYQKAFSGDIVSCELVDVEFDDIETGDEIETAPGVKSVIYSEDGSETYMYLPVELTNKSNSTVELWGNISSTFLLDGEYTYEGDIDSNGMEIPALSKLTIFLRTRIPKTLAESFKTVNLKIGIDNNAESNSNYKELDVRDNLFEYEYGTEEAEKSASARPVAEYEKIVDGQELVFDNYTLTLDSLFQANEISETSGSFTYSFGTKNSNNVYVYLRFVAKNNSNEVIEFSTLDSCMPGIFVIDNEYEYEATCAPVKQTELGPFEEVYLYLKAEVAPEILDKMYAGKTNIKFGINDDLKYDGMSKIEKCDHLYEYDLDMTENE